MMNDILNILICVTQLLPAICAKGEELIGVELTTLGKIIRDVHAKCHELLVCLLLRGAPLHYLFKVLCKIYQVNMYIISLWHNTLLLPVQISLHFEMRLKQRGKMEIKFCWEKLKGVLFT